ncbi:hypothetical protein AXG93_1160s1030 [Marchantia polymorpha subsp. ruderalis]|uniref:F-box domain-containing protein n=1 Tax=Marchantia polymorpha subsp. ruderalis TaxID=1480154 RepID=A0A176VMA9_MARPO|nr:hypothetical protein AXG93_1160s1030 [Marchantia polymorpha subsp. ruderalis]
MGICLGARPKCTCTFSIAQGAESISPSPASPGSSYDTIIVHCSSADADDTEYSSSTPSDPALATSSSTPLMPSSQCSSWDAHTLRQFQQEEEDEEEKEKERQGGGDKEGSGIGPLNCSGRSDGYYDQDAGLGIGIDRGSLNCLPDEIMVKILAALPVLNLVRNRVVCKRWNEVLSSASLQDMSLPQPRDSWTLFYDNNHGEAAMYNVGMNRWFALPLSSVVPSQFQIANTSARGLLCVTGHVRGNFVVGMCNPLTQAFRQLPPLLHNRYHADVSAMDAPDSAAGYKILATGYRVLEMDVTSEIYDSQSDSWRVLDKHPKKRKLARYVHDYPVHQSCSLDGKFYFFTNDSDGGHGSGQIVGFDTYDDVWFSVESPQWIVLRRSLYWNPCLLARNGCLILAGGAKCSKTCSSQPGCSSIQIWKLDLVAPGGEWMEIARMPAPMFRRFHTQFETFRCFGHVDRVEFATYSATEGLQCV